MPLDDCAEKNYKRQTEILCPMNKQVMLPIIV
jgi:hypothetical protein